MVIYKYPKDPYEQINRPRTTMCVDCGGLIVNNGYHICTHAEGWGREDEEFDARVKGKIPREREPNRRPGRPSLKPRADKPLDAPVRPAPKAPAAPSAPEKKPEEKKKDRFELIELD